MILKVRATVMNNTALVSNYFFWGFLCLTYDKLWKILQEMGAPGHLSCLLRNLYASQEATVRTGHGTTDWFQKGKGVCQG